MIKKLLTTLLGLVLVFGALAMTLGVLLSATKTQLTPPFNFDTLRV